MSADDPDRLADSAQETALPPPEPRDPPPPGSRFTPGTLLAGRYRIVSPLGKGGMGEVYRADDVRLGQPVALKFLPAALAADEGRLQRLVDEVRIGRQISHPNVCRLYDIGEAQGQHFLVMEYVDGEDLASLLHRIGRLPGDKALEIARGLCAGLAAAHDKGVIHRDLKPANVMIDGHGHARVADFGLAALAGTVAVGFQRRDEPGAGPMGAPSQTKLLRPQAPVGGFAGTPAYMAPEQLAGGAASLRSDVFALGLVLHEMLSGRRVFDAQSLDELRRLHVEARPKRLSSSVKDVDPALERVVLSCLAADPAARPASARVVLAALPGGDALQAALLAGETPSPEMVAAAAEVGDLSPPRAWAGLISGLLGLLLVAFLAERIMLHGVVPLRKPPEVLAEQARELLGRLGRGAPAVDASLGFFVDVRQIAFVREHAAGADWWRTLRSSRPGPWLFYLRQSPTPLYSRNWTLVLPWFGPADLGRITRTDPPTTTPGMAEVVLDAQGRLVRLLVVPLAVAPSAAQSAATDWTLALTAAGFDPTSLRATTPVRVTPVDSDEKRAWVGANPELPEVPLVIEAASHRGRLVHFEVQGPWARTSTSAPRTTLAAFVFGAFLLAVSGAAFVLVRRNLRLGRGDRRGALRLWTFTFFSIAIANLFRADHSALWLVEYHLIVQIVSQSLYLATGVWLAYVALEPVVRRRWPHALISWSRLLAGRFLDPLVGRDVLTGMLAGLAATLVMQLALIAPGWLGGLAPEPGLTTASSLSAPWHMTYYVLLSPVLSMIQALLSLFFLYLLHALLARPWAARALFVAFFVPVIAARPTDPLTEIGAGVLFMTLFAFLLARFGQLAATAQLFVFWLLIRTPLTLDWSAWYAGRSFAVLGLLAALLVATAYTSLGGKPPFGNALLDE